MKKINYLDSIIHPIITEKATSLSEQNKITFKVRDDASKKSIKKNIEKIFKVTVIQVNTVNKKSKTISFRLTKCSLCKDDRRRICCSGLL